MKYIQIALCIVVFLLSSFNSYTQWFRVTETTIDPDKIPKGFIGAELPADSIYYHKTSDGLDSVILGSYTIYDYNKKRVYTVEGTVPLKNVFVSYFKGIVSNGQMQEGELHIEDPYFQERCIYRGAFKNNRADGIGIYSRTSTTFSKFKTSCKAFFENGYPGKKGLLKLNYDSSGTPTLYYSGDILLGYSNKIVLDGYGSYLRTDYVKPSFYHEYGVGVANAYYEGQIDDSRCTGFGIYNVFDYEQKKTSNLKVGLLAADYPVVSFSTLPINAQVPDKVEKKNEGLYILFPKIDSAKGAYFVYNGRNYAGMEFAKKPYGFGIMQDADGFYEMGFWKNGVRINTKELLNYLLPDSTVLIPKEVVNKISRFSNVYNSRKNKYVTEEETRTATITYYGRQNAEGKIEGWGWRKGGFETEVGNFLPFVPESGKKITMPKAADVFQQAFSIQYGSGEEQGYITEKNRYRFYTNALYKNYASQIVPYGGIPLWQRDANTIALTEYRDKRNYEVEGYKKYIASRIEENKIKEAQRKAAFDALFLTIANPSAAEIRNCVGKFYLNRSGSHLYKVLKLETGNQNQFMVGIYATHSFSSNHIYISAKDLLGSGEFRPVQPYVVCRSCGGTGTISSSYSYTADYEYTYGAKIKTTTTKTAVCGCGCGIEPEQFGAKRDW